MAIELACNGLFGQLEAPPELESCAIALYDADAWRLFHDFEILRALEVSDTLEPSWAGLLRSELNRFCNEHDPAILAALYEHHNGTRAHEIAAIGHAHIDTAWLWPLAETYRKLVRTFSSQTRYMDEYPEFRFACSQAQQYAWIKERDPDLWERIRAKVETGQFVPVGGSWVEPDCNIPSGESLLRQFIHGQRFFEDEFGIRCREFWSPDAFGYCSQLPQLMRLAGMTRFLTQKLSWNRFNRPDSHTFIWQGIDGSEVLGALPARRHLQQRRERQGAALRRARVQGSRVERGRACSSSATATAAAGRRARCSSRFVARATCKGCRARARRRATSSSRRSRRRTRSGRVVVGELYFEYHRGVYTSQAFTSAATACASNCCTMRSSWRRRAATIRATSSTGSGSSCCCSSSTTSSPARRSGSSTTTRAATSPSSSVAEALVGTGETPVNTIGVREARGGAIRPASSSWSRRRRMRPAGSSRPTTRSRSTG